MSFPSKFYLLLLILWLGSSSSGSTTTASICTGIVVWNDWRCVIDIKDLSFDLLGSVLILAEFLLVHGLETVVLFVYIK